MTEIRPLSLSERPEWERLMAAYAGFYKTEVSPEGLAEVWSWIHGSEEFWCDLALIGGQVVGMAQYQLMHRSLSGQKVVYLSDLYVDPDRRGAGLGRALIDHVIGFTRGRGISNVRWLTQETNYAGRRLYDTYRPKSEFILYSLPVA